MDLLTDCYKRGVIGYLDLRIARFCADLASTDDALAALAFGLTCRATAEGHVCIDLSRAVQQSGFSESISSDAWIERLSGHPAVSRPDGAPRPFVVDAAGRMYLYRYWACEQRLVAAIRQRIAAEAMPPMDARRLRDGLDRMFPAPEDGLLRGPALAGVVASLKRFCVVTGGPGTGKTTVIARILALLVDQTTDRPPPRIHLTAPTGKAAARLGAAVSTVLSDPALHPAADPIPHEAQTLHRLLAKGGNTPYGTARRLPTDVVVVDEASMVDLALMAELVAAMPPSARLILVGDRDQLASVEPGAVFGDICGASHISGFGTSFRRLVSDITARSLPEDLPTASLPMADAVVTLVKSYRFSDTDGIGAVAGAVLRGDRAAARRAFESQSAAVWARPAGGMPFTTLFQDRILDGYGDAVTAGSPEKALELFNRFRVLCATNVGPFGVGALNELARRILMEQHRLAPGKAIWYPGRPVLITRNAYDLNLFNGDVGIAVPDPELGLAVCFPGPGGAVRRFSPYRLPAHETAYAMTVHKSQGSEFDAVLMVLPERDMPVLSRQLLYTGVTRARRRLTLWARTEILDAALRRSVKRTSGLNDALWQPDWHPAPEQDPSR